MKRTDFEMGRLDPGSSVWTQSNHVRNGEPFQAGSERQDRKERSEAWEGLHPRLLVLKMEEGG